MWLLFLPEGMLVPLLLGKSKPRDHPAVGLIVQAVNRMFSYDTSNFAAARSRWRQQRLQIGRLSMKSAAQ